MILFGLTAFNRRLKYELFNHWILGKILWLYDVQRKHNGGGIMTGTIALLVVVTGLYFTL